MPATLSFTEKAKLRGYDPVVLVRGKLRGGGVPFFAYVIMTVAEYDRFARDKSVFAGMYDALKQREKIILEGEGDPTADQRAYMEEHYEFDHSKVEW